MLTCADIVKLVTDYLEGRLTSPERSRFEAHVAIYPPGTGYTRHADRFARDPRRALSTVLYLNEDWQPGDGGALRIHLGGGAWRDLEPRGGTLVIFASELEHEVLPARRERLSLAGWFKRRG